MEFWLRLIAVLTSLVTVAGSSAPTGTAPDAASATPSKTPVRKTVTVDRASVVVQRAGSGSAPASTLAAGAATSAMDFDRDGKDELVVSGFSTGYGVTVEYSGLGWRDSITAPVSSPTSPNFGDAMTSGDFDHDGYADLVVANPGELAPSGSQPAFGGGVWIFYGSPQGLDLTAPQHITQDTAGVPGVMQGYDMFGDALAAGDVNGDGHDDLAIGSRGEDVNGYDYAGSVTVLLGSPTGVTTTGAQLLTQDTAGIPNIAEASDAFGSALAIGDMTRDGYADLAISAPSEGEWSSPFENGLIMLLRGGPNGITTSGVTSIRGIDLGDIAAIGDAMSIADIDGDGDGDLVAGAPRSWIGYILFVPGTTSGMDVARARVISMETPSVPGDPYVHVDDSPHSYFGQAIATGDVTGDGRADVLTGAVRYDVGGVLDAGAVLLIPGTAAGLTGAGSLMLTQLASAPAPGRRPGPGGFDPAEREDYFGNANAILNLDGTGPLDLVTASNLDGEHGRVVELAVRNSAPRRPGAPGATTTSVPTLVAVRSWSGADIGWYSLGRAILHR